jgi:SAM-dependent methyltransferase
MPDLEWKEYWERLKDERKIFFSEAVEYVSRLSRAICLSEHWRVLDFGCGFGYTAVLLATRVREVYLWDQAENMRNRARANVSMLKNAICIEASNAEEFPRCISFDLILVNSVIQYMSQPEFVSWLQVWKRILSPEGRIVISDILSENVRPVSDIFSLIRFSAARGFLSRALWKGLRELKWYFKMRRARPLRRYSEGELKLIAAEEGLDLCVFPQNLTFRNGRLSVSFSRPGN